MGKWEMVKLGDVCDIQAGRTPSRSNQNYWANGTIPWVKIGDIKGKYVNNTAEYITDFGLQNSSSKLFEKGTILYTIFATLGETAILNIDACTNQAIAGLKVKNKKVLSDFLFYFLISKKSSVIESGRSFAQNNITLSILKNVQVKLPPLDEQKKITNELDKITDLIAKRKTQMEKLELLVKSRFIEMFGDPVTNPKEWNVKALPANEKTNSIYVHYWFSFFQKILEAQATESAQKNINLQILNELKIMTPPLPLQTQFADYVQKAEATKASIQKSLEKLETIKKAIMKFYFE